MVLLYSARPDDLCSAHALLTQAPPQLCASSASSIKAALDPESETIEQGACLHLPTRLVKGGLSGSAVSNDARSMRNATVAQNSGEIIQNDGIVGPPEAGALVQVNMCESRSLSVASNTTDVRRLCSLFETAVALQLFADQLLATLQLVKAQAECMDTWCWNVHCKVCFMISVWLIL